MALKINFDALPKDNPQGELALEGYHRARIVSAKTGVSKDKGTPFMEIVMELEHTTGKTNKFTDTFYITDNTYTQFKLQRFLLITGMGISGADTDLDMVVKVLPGKELCVLINHQKDKKNPEITRAQVNFFKDGYFAVEEFLKQTGAVPAEQPADPDVPFV
jgi:hypothetical protein